MQLTEGQLEQYRTEGYTVVRGLISPEEGCRVRNRLMDLLAGDHDWPDTHFQVLDPSKFRNKKDGFLPIGVQRPAMREGNFQSGSRSPELAERDGTVARRPC